MLAPGANAKLRIADVRAAAATIRAADVVLVQLEVPLDVVEFTVELCRRAGVRVVLDPAPTPAMLPPALYGVDALCPNEGEAAALLGCKSTPVSAARRLIARRAVGRP